MSALFYSSGIICFLMIMLKRLHKIKSASLGVFSMSLTNTDDQTPLLHYFFLELWKSCIGAKRVLYSVFETSNAYVSMYAWFIHYRIFLKEILGKKE